MMNAEQVSARLRGRTLGGGKFEANCPLSTHNNGRGDRSRSLSLADGSDGSLRLHCKGGCSPHKIAGWMKQRGWPIKSGVAGNGIDVGDSTAHQSSAPELPRQQSGVNPVEESEPVEQQDHVRPEHDDETHPLLVEVIRPIALAKGLAKLQALQDGARRLAISVRHGFLERADVVDRLFEQAGNVGLLEDVGEAVVIQRITQGLEDFGGDDADGGARQEPPPRQKPPHHEARGSDPSPNRGRAGGENPGAQSRGKSTKRSAILVRADRVPRKAMKWAWLNRFAFGKIALIAGDPGLGKSQLGLDIIARMTTGDLWPADGERAPVAEAIVLTAEDGLGDTVAPRLVAAEADLSKVHFLTGTRLEGGKEEIFDLTRDVEALRDMLRQQPDIKAIVIDPLTAYLGETKAQRNSEVRKALAPLVRLIEETGVLVIGITHLNKSAGKAIYRVLESIGFVAVGRILHMVVADPDNPINRKFLCAKTNIGAVPKGLQFICQQVPVSTEDGDAWVSRICWDPNPLNETADQALRAEGDSSDKGSALDEAKQFLSELLADKPVAADQVWAAADANRISERTLKRAKRDLGVIAKKVGLKEGWTWSLPPEGGQPRAEGGQ